MKNYLNCLFIFLCLKAQIFEYGIHEQRTDRDIVKDVQIFNQMFNVIVSDCEYGIENSSDLNKDIINFELDQLKSCSYFGPSVDRKCSGFDRNKLIIEDQEAFCKSQVYSMPSNNCESCKKYDYFDQKQLKQCIQIISQVNVCSHIQRKYMVEKYNCLDISLFDQILIQKYNDEMRNQCIKNFNQYVQYPDPEMWVSIEDIKQGKISEQTVNSRLKSIGEQIDEVNNNNQIYQDEIDILVKDSKFFDYFKGNITVIQKSMENFIEVWADCYSLLAAKSQIQSKFSQKTVDSVNNLFQVFITYDFNQIDDLIKLDLNQTEKIQREIVYLYDDYYKQIEQYKIDVMKVCLKGVITIDEVRARYIIHDFDYDLNLVNERFLQFLKSINSVNKKGLDFIVDKIKQKQKQIEDRKKEIYYNNLMNKQKLLKIFNRFQYVKGEIEKYQIQI